jgi:glutamate synthase domain-containing protein 2
MSPFWVVFWGALAALAVLGLAVLAIWRPAVRSLLNIAADSVVGRMVKDTYTENVFGVLNAMRHAGGQTFFETMMRAATGKPVPRPMGSPLHPSPWEQLLFQPVYLRPRLPTPEGTRIGTATTIGPRAPKPLRVDIPILIAGMSYGGALSVEAKVALARGANLAGTATNSGESYLPEERRAAERLILQHHRGLWPNGTMNRPELLKNADAVEIQLGQGAQAAAAMKTMPPGINEKMREAYGVDRGEPAGLATRFRGVDSPQGFVEMVRRLKRELQVPVGVKLGVSDYIEEDLDVFLDAGVDFVTVDGSEGGTHGGPPTLQDDVGLPTMHGLVRADDHLRRAGARDRVTLIAAGQLTTPGKMLKALALGADAVYVGTAAVVALMAEQIQKAMPVEPAFDLVMHGATARWNRALDVETAAQNLANYLQSCMADVAFVVQSLGKRSVRELDRGDLVALEPAVADLCGVRLAWRPRSDTLAFEANLAAMARGDVAADRAREAESPRAGVAPD